MAPPLCVTNTGGWAATGGTVALTIENQQHERIEGEAQGSSDARKSKRFSLYRLVDWDYFSEAGGAKLGFIEDLSEGGCLLRTVQAIGHRRVIRLMIKDPVQNVWLTAVGRVIRREDKMEAIPGSGTGNQPWGVTLHRFGIQFIRPVNAVALEALRESTPSCSECGSPAAPDEAHVEELHSPGRRYCALCHLRKACHNLLIQTGLEQAEPLDSA